MWKAPPCETVLWLFTRRGPVKGGEEAVQPLKAWTPSETHAAKPPCGPAPDRPTNHEPVGCTTSSRFSEIKGNQRTFIAHRFWPPIMARILHPPPNQLVGRPKGRPKRPTSWPTPRLQKVINSSLSHLQKKRLLKINCPASWALNASAHLSTGLTCKNVRKQKLQG